MLLQLLRGDGATGDDHRVHRLAPLLVGHAEHRSFEHRAWAVQRLFDLGAVHVLGAGDDHVLGPVDEEDERTVVGGTRGRRIGTNRRQ